MSSIKIFLITCQYVWKSDVKRTKKTARRPHTRKKTQENIDLSLKDLNNQLHTPEMRNTKTIDKFSTLMSSLTNLYFL